ncbi:MAG: PrgI family protein [Chloroflexi bacterium]|nr:PrgI family protein [Chloroflexota bacterium]
MPEVKGLGLTPGNPFAPFVIGGFTIAGGALIVLLGLTLFAGSIDTRYTAGLVLMFVAVLAPIPLALLAIYSRNYVRIQRVLAGDHWAHWRYPVESRNGSEVYLGPLGVYWPERRRLRDFKSGLIEVEHMPDTLVFRYVYKQYSRYGSFAHKKEERVPIPFGKEDEAAELVKHFQTQLGIPSGFINDSWTIAWIMGGIIIAAVIVSILLVLPLEFTRQDIRNDAWSTQYAATRQAETALLQRDLQPILRVLEPQLDRLKAAGTREYDPADLGFPADANVQRVVTGFCVPSEAFYVLVWQETPTVEGFFGSRGVYHYVDGEWDYGCMPPLYQPDGLKTVTDDWNFVFLKGNTAIIATMLVEELQKTPTPEP